MKKNYYLVLGVNSTATLEEIKSAFRRRAKELHPDHSGSESEPFLEIQEAYGVLSDPKRRRYYDRQGQAGPVRRPRWGPTPEPLVSRRSKAEPLKPFADRDVSIETSFESFRPSFEEIFARLWSNYDLWPKPKAERLENLTVEVSVSPGEAALGGDFRLEIPGLATCPTCGGRGAVDIYECWRCRGEGALATGFPIEIQYLPEIRDGYGARVSLKDFGIENLYLTVVFRIDGNQEYE